MPLFLVFFSLIVDVVILTVDQTLCKDGRTDFCKMSIPGLAVVVISSKLGTFSPEKTNLGTHSCVCACVCGYIHGHTSLL